MKKQELIHVHGLLGEVARYCNEEGYAVDLTEYKQLGTTPTSIHLRKAEHKEALFKLNDAIISAVQPDSVDTVAPEPASAD